MTVSDATGSAKALVKGIAIVSLLASHRKGLRLTDLVSEVDLPRGTVVRLLNVLLDARLIRHSADFDPALLNLAFVFLFLEPVPVR